ATHHETYSSPPHTRHHFLTMYFSFNATAPTQIYTLSLHDASSDLDVDDAQTGAGERLDLRQGGDVRRLERGGHQQVPHGQTSPRSEEHTSELQSPDHLVCRLLLEKKNNSKQTYTIVETESRCQQKH